MKKLFLSFATVALMIASAAGSSMKVTLFEKSFIGGEELKPGDYKIEVNGDKATIKNGKQVVEATVKSETGSQKFDATSVRYDSFHNIRSGCGEELLPDLEHSDNLAQFLE